MGKKGTYSNYSIKLVFSILKILSRYNISEGRSYN